MPVHLFILKLHSEKSVLEYNLPVETVPVIYCMVEFCCALCSQSRSETVALDAFCSVTTYHKTMQQVFSVLSAFTATIIRQDRGLTVIRTAFNQQDFRPKHTVQLYSTSYIVCTQMSQNSNTWVYLNKEQIKIDFYVQQHIRIHACLIVCRTG